MSRLCVHTITTKPLTLEQCLAEYPQRGIGGITIWRQALEGRDLGAVQRQVADSGMELVSLCRGGFFPAPTAAARQSAIDDNLQAIEQAHAIGAPLVVLVSCDAASLGRDAGLLAGHGYALEAVTLVDMFPDTSHVEVVSVFRSGW